jgi:DNA replication protein DnaC
MRNSGLGEVIDRLTFDKFIVAEQWQENAKRLAVNFSEAPYGRWFFAGGQVGSGKTHLCTAIALELLKNGRTTRYMLWRDESVKLKAIVNDSTYYDKVNVFKTADVLYIDDFLKTEKGKPPTTADINLAFEIINYRYCSHKLITIISCERFVDDILDVDEAVGSRIYERTKAGTLLEISHDKSKNYRMGKNT